MWTERPDPPRGRRGGWWWSCAGALVVAGWCCGGAVSCAPGRVPVAGEERDGGFRWFRESCHHGVDLSLHARAVNANRRANPALAVVPDGFFAVMAHGGRGGARGPVIYDERRFEHGNLRRSRALAAEDLLRVIREDTGLAARLRTCRGILLFSCHTGSPGVSCPSFAQRLADLAELPVWAPDGVLIMAHGHVLSGDQVPFRRFVPTAPVFSFARNPAWPGEPCGGPPGVASATAGHDVGRDADGVSGLVLSEGAFRVSR